MNFDDMELEDELDYLVNEEMWNIEDFVIKKLMKAERGNKTKKKNKTIKVVENDKLGGIDG